MLTKKVETNQPNPQEVQEDELYRQEQQILKAGARALMVERWPINDRIENCFNENSAYLCSLEQQYLQVPKSESYENLENSIRENHRARLHGLSGKFVSCKFDLEQKTKELKQHWKNSPKNTDRDSRKMVQSSPIVLRKGFRKSTMAVISQSPELAEWRTREKSLRIELHDLMKNFIISLRAYLEALLEKQDGQYVLNENHPLRQKIAIHNRYVQLIDAIFTTIDATKKETYRQKKGRVRKTEAKPAVFHATEVTFSAIRNTIPFIIEEQQLDVSPVVMAVTAAFHDIFEDTDLSMDEIMQILKTQLNSHSVTIESGFGMTVEKFSAKILDIMNKRTTRTTKTGIRVLSNNTVLSNKEKKIAAIQNIGGAKKTMAELGITQEALAEWFPKMGQKTKAIKKGEKLEALRKFPVEYDNGKILRFLIRLHALTQSPDARQIFVDIKNCDRADSLATLEKMPIQSQLKILRATVSRLIAYEMLDHNHAEMPLYQTLPDLIDKAVKAYHLFAENHPKEMRTIDHRLIEQAEQWQLEVIRRQVPKKIQRVMDRFHKAKNRKVKTAEAA